MFFSICWTQYIIIWRQLSQKREPRTADMKNCFQIRVILEWAAKSTLHFLALLEKNTQMMSEIIVLGQVFQQERLQGTIKKHDEIKLYTIIS